MIDPTLGNFRALELFWEFVLNQVWDSGLGSCFKL